MAINSLTSSCDTISEGDVVCIIEAMKFMNEVNSELSGTIAEVLVKDGQFVITGSCGKCPAKKGSL